MNPNSLPDDPYRVAPPGQAPGEIELREPTQAEIAEMEAQVAREVFESLKHGHDFTMYDEIGYWSKWDYDDLFETLANELHPHEMAQILAALMDKADNVYEARFIKVVRNFVHIKAIAPFVEVQARWRLDAAIKQEAQAACESWRDE